jgi:hypothetical protein
VIGSDCRLQELPEKGFTAHGYLRILLVQNELEKDLVGIEIHTSSPNLTSEYRYVVVVREFQIYFLVEILVIANAEIAGGRDARTQCLSAKVGQSVIDELRLFPRDSAQII